MTKRTLTINGTAHELDVDDAMPLLWALRDLLGLTGTKYGCGLGQCRACVVHIDGAPVFSCQVPASAVGDKPIVTIEGLGQGKKNGLHIVQQAWIDEQVPQCGYCQSGQIMAAAALLSTTPNPTDAQIDAALFGHICRCGTYQRIRSAIHRAAAAADGGDAQSPGSDGGTP